MVERRTGSNSEVACRVGAFEVKTDRLGGCVVDHNVAVEGRDDAVLKLLEDNVRIAECLQACKVAICKFLILFVVEVSSVE